MIYWMLLLLAIVLEVAGTLAMKWSATSGNSLGYVFMLLLIALSYISLSVAIKRIALGVAYALWEGVGILLITLFGVWLFEESVPPLKMAGLATLVSGIALIKSGTRGRRAHASV